jgi:PTS system galactitol-specific IIA component
MMTGSDKQLEALIPPEFVLVGLAATDKVEAIRSLGALLKEKGYVKDTYVKAVLDREKEFPTGLRTLDVHVAIPHCDVGHCLEPGIAVGVLKSPVEFIEMATHDQIVDAEIIFLLAITEPDQQVIWLSRLVTLFQTPGFLGKLRNAINPKEGHSIITEALLKEVVLEKEK